MIAKGKLISASDIFEQTLSFYDTIIAILLGILGLVVALVILFIWKRSKDELDEQVNHAVSSFLTEKIAGKTLLDKVMDDKIAEYQLDKAAEKISQLESKSSKIEEEVESLNSESKTPKNVANSPMTGVQNGDH